MLKRINQSTEDKRQLLFLKHYRTYNYYFIIYTSYHLYIYGGHASACHAPHKYAYGHRLTETKFLVGPQFNLND